MGKISSYNVDPLPELTTEPETEDVSLVDDDDVKCKDHSWGWGSFRPRCMQMFNTSRWFVFFLICLAIFSGMTGASLSGSIQTLESRFQFSSKDAGLIAAANDISGLILLPVVSFFGDFRHKPKWLGYGGLLTGIGSLLFIVPQALIGRYEPRALRDTADNSTRPFLCSPDADILSDTSCDPSAVPNQVLYLIFIVARLFMGAGSTPLYSMGPAFLDDNASPKFMPVYIGLFYASLPFGPGIGFLMTGFFVSQIYIDITLPSSAPDLTIRDSRWLGCWWLSFLISGIALVISGIMLLGYPYELPGAQQRRKELMEKGELPPQDKKIKGKVKDILPATRSLFMNPVYLLQVIGKLLTQVFWFGLGAFIFKIWSELFGASPSELGLGAFFVTTPGLAFGIMLSGFISKKANLKETCQKAAKWAFFTSILGWFASVCWLIPGCLPINLAGVTAPYQNFSLPTEASVLATCNSQCLCDTKRYEPVCGADDITYFSACHAGCTHQTGIKEYSNCTCIPESVQHKSVVIKGSCDRKCKNFAFFIGTQTSMIVLTSLNIVPTQIVTMRSVPDNQRSYALGIQTLLTRLLGNLPSPILWGYFMDSLCLLWQPKCNNEKGNCLEYNMEMLVVIIVVVSLSCQVIQSFLFFWCWIFSRKIQNVSTKEIITIELKETNDQEPNDFPDCNGTENHREHDLHDNHTISEREDSAEAQELDAVNQGFDFNDDEDIFNPYEGTNNPAFQTEDQMEYEDSLFNVLITVENEDDIMELKDVGVEVKKMEIPVENEDDNKELKDAGLEEQEIEIPVENQNDIMVLKDVGQEVKEIAVENQHDIMDFKDVGLEVKEVEIPLENEDDLIVAENQDDTMELQDVVTEVNDATNTTWDKCDLMELKDERHELKEIEIPVENQDKITELKDVGLDVKEAVPQDDVMDLKDVGLDVKETVCP